MPISVEDILAQVEKYRLMPPRDLAALRARWYRPGHREVADTARFCEWVRGNHLLTDFVLAALVRGKADQLILNQYRLIDLVRSGAQAGDFLATDPLDRTLRLQIVAPALVHDAAGFEKFRQMVQRVLDVRHPGVARVFDLGQTRAAVYLVGEYVEGDTLEEILKKRGKLDADVTARILAVAFDALHALHQNSVPGGDLGADSLVLTAADRSTGGRSVRLANPTLPRRLFDASALGILSKDEFPEAARRARSDDERSAFDGIPRPEEDNFRLGSLGYRCLTGREPYPGEALRAGRTPPSVRSAAPEAPALLADLIDRLIQPQPGSRPRSAAAVARVLRNFLKTEEGDRQGGGEYKIIVPAPGSSPGSRAAVEELGETICDAEVLAAAPSGLEAAARPGEPEICRFFRVVMEHEGSDLHLAVDCPPLMRVRGEIRQMDHPALSQEDMERLVGPLLSPRTEHQLEEAGGADFAYVIGKGEGRFRVNLFRQRGQLSLVARRVNTRVPTFEELHLPPVMIKLCQYDQGMVIVAGVTGSGKSTTLAAMLDYINEREQIHILTIEDPIEYLFTRKKAVINQRELGLDVTDWHVALKHAVRQDPDVILVGEMRDRETFEAGINAAETGHLVFCTIHASTAPSTLARILDLFPADMHQAMRQSLAFNLRAIVCQKLLPSIRPGVQRVPANEILIVNPTVRELILKGEDKKLPDAIHIGLIEGMVDFNESLRQLVARGDVDRATALAVSPNPDALKMAFKGIKVAQAGILH